MCIAARLSECKGTGKGIATPRSSNRRTNQVPQSESQKANSWREGEAEMKRPWIFQQITKNPQGCIEMRFTRILHILTKMLHSEGKIRSSVSQVRPQDLCTLGVQNRLSYFFGKRIQQPGQDHVITSHPCLLKHHIISGNR